MIVNSSESWELKKKWETNFIGNVANDIWPFENSIKFTEGMLSYLIPYVWFNQEQENYRQTTSISIQHGH